MLFLICWSSSVVSAGTLRIFGTDIAELPLVALQNFDWFVYITVTYGCHCSASIIITLVWSKQGYFQTLFSCIEGLLAFFNVKNLVLPAAEEAESICTDKFVFSKIKQDQVYSSFLCFWGGIYILLFCLAFLKVSFI